MADGILDTDRPHNLPLEPPTFTLKTIRDAIPAHCFQRNLYISLTHLISDLAVVALLAYGASWISSPTAPAWSPYILWPMYWYAQGAVLTGVWVLAHECGHQSFSESELANNIVGTICHSLLLVPYHAWRITHGKHHNNTGSCENDEVFAPSTRSDWAKEMLRDTPFAQGLGVVIMLTVGWMPGYLVMNMTGPKKYRGKNANHFSPTATFFKPEEYWLIVQTNFAFSMAVGLLAFCIYSYGKYLLFLTIKTTVEKRASSFIAIHHISLTIYQLIYLITNRLRGGSSILFDPIHDRQLPLGIDHVLATHRRFHASLQRCRVVMVERCPMHRRSFIRTYPRPHIPPHLRHPCVPPLVLKNAFLSRTGSH